MTRLLLWIAFWGTAVFFVAWQVFHQNPVFVLVAIGLVFVFMMVNGISLGISDSNPISSAFVLTVFILAAFGLTDATAGLVCASILLISVSVGGDMQQDRSTGWRLGTNRVLQFRYQVVGIAMGAVLSVGMAALFMGGNPELKLDQTNMSKDERPERWQSAMTYKFVGALDGFIGRPAPVEQGTALTPKEKDLLEKAQKDPAHALVPVPGDLGSEALQKAYAVKLEQAHREHKKAIQTEALIIGICIGLVTEGLRKIIKSRKGYQKFKASGTAGFATDFALDALFLPSPYASSFGGFVDFTTSLWFGIGGIFSSYSDTVRNEALKEGRAAAAKNADGEPTEGVPDDMSTNSLVGGGLIAGDSLAALYSGASKLISTL